MAQRWLGSFLPLLLLSWVRSESPNVALKKRVVGSGERHPSTIDGKFHTTFSPFAVQFLYYFVDLGAVYNLTSINLFCQNLGTFYNQGLNKPFDVHTYDQYMSDCGFGKHYPWDVLATNLTFKKKGEEIVLKPEKPVQYIISGRQNNVYPRSVRPIVIGEVQAHGEVLREASIPQVPRDDRPALPHDYLDTRKTILGTQDIIEMDPSYVYFQPNVELRDVVFAWDKRPKAMAVMRGKARMAVIMGHTIVKDISSSPL
ncbi:hypothetical protein CRM22_008815 [Opisthorchis felineus]|uniref:Uncharacterized protein n=1 Tax=Opisthorchis felineus TaxID=147828 RepID=A0A4S2LA24_OPIFE|nr:hypothetical protein CRM22_008815 [Opisthorchis felineus]